MGETKEDKKQPFTESEAYLRDIQRETANVNLCLSFLES